MGPRDPIKTARNRKVAEMKLQLRELLPQVLNETKISSESSLNAIIGGKAAEFIDLHHEVILSSEAYVELYLRGFKKAISESPHLEDGSYSSNHQRNFALIRSSKAAQKYFLLFLRRSYLNHYEELTRIRPRLEESQIWIGQNNADYGLFITPRFKNGEWENDRSEIRHFPKLYWTIGHVLQSGLVVPHSSDRISFHSIEQYLVFFRNVIVRNSGSQHEIKIADLYTSYVKTSSDPEKIPLLIPEYRYEGQKIKHRYRLDFTIINPYTMDKVGFELSPWSTHGYLSNTKNMSQSEINEIAKGNFEKEMEKHRSFFKEHGIFSLIYTDKQLANIESVFEDISRHLNPVDRLVQIDFDLLDSFFD